MPFTECSSITRREAAGDHGLHPLSKYHVLPRKPPGESDPLGAPTLCLAVSQKEENDPVPRDDRSSSDYISDLFFWAIHAVS